MITTYNIFGQQTHFKTKYKKKIHRLVAIGFAFTGCGTIDWYKITDLKSGVMKGESFVK